MEQSFIEALWGGIQIILASVNWVFVPLFIIIMWLFNEGIESESDYNWLNWIQKIPRGLRVFLTGIVLALGFSWFYDLQSKSEIASLAYGIMVGMVIWKLGIEKFFEWFKEHVWHGNLEASKKVKPLKPKSTAKSKTKSKPTQELKNNTPEILG